MANKRSCRALKRLFTTYEKASGQAINLRKSAITFGRHVKAELKRYIRHNLDIHNDGGGGFYLGLPEKIQSKKTETFRFIVDRVRKKTQTWNKRFLSTGGKEILIKAVATAMPTYNMNLFKLPTELCNEIHSTLADYWWRKSDQSKGMHWFAWKRLCLPKKEGGIGFKYLEQHNLAMLGKQTWRIMQNPSCLMARLLQGRYFPDGNILTANPGSKASFLWKSLLQGRDLVRKGLRYNIGTGRDISAWQDPWLFTHPPRPPRPKSLQTPNICVKELIDVTSNSWDLVKLEEYVHPEDIPTIKLIKLTGHGALDYLGWNYTDNGHYSVRSAYWLATHLPNGQQLNPPPGNIALRTKGWKLHTASKLQHFCWQIITNSLPTGENLKRRHITQQSLCRRCCSEEETTAHLFFECTYSQALWRGSNVPVTTLFDANLSWETKLKAIFDLNVSNPATDYQHLPIWLLWRIWKSRNVLVFQRKHIPWTITLAQAKRDAKEWTISRTYVQEHAQGVPSAPNGHADQWQKPECSWVKCNYDASFTTGLPSRAGWIIRDHEGSYHGSGQTIGHITHNPLMSEFQALLIAMQNVWVRGHRSVCFEGDNSLLCQILNKSLLHFASYNYQCEIRAWASRFENVSFIWTKRKNNEAAHRLAKMAFQDNASTHYFNKAPLLICNVI